MRIGLYMPQLSPENGGGFTINDTILRALINYQGRHEFYIFFKGENIFEDTVNIKYITLGSENSDDTTSTSNYRIIRIIKKLFNRAINKINIENEKNQSLNQLIYDYSIEFFWFISAFHEPVDIPYIYTIWDLQHRLQPYFPEVSVTGWTWENRERFYSLIIKKAAYVIIANNAGKNELIKFYQIPDERIIQLPHPTPQFALFPEKYSDKFRSNLKISGKYIFYPAQFWPHKNHICILLALRYLKEKYNFKIKVVFTGSDLGNMEYIKEKADEFDLNKQIMFLGFVSIEKLINLYKGAFALVYPSFFGPENLPPLEAFALGCPVIASNVSGAKEQFGDAALLFNPRNEMELARSIKYLDDHKAYRKTLIKRGLKRAKNWTAVDYIEGVVKIIDDFEPIRRSWSSKEKFVHL
jgi:glycosyltransferase involved in cell wall biosynthesis